LSDTLSADEPDVDLRRVEFVGPQVGQELREQGGLATIFVLLLIFAYVMIRFQWKLPTLQFIQRAPRRFI
jgi:preprotein translocase subunit SecF